MRERHEKWLGVGRAGWLRVQFSIGVMNALLLIYDVEAKRWINAAISLTCVFLTANWRLPKAPHKPLSKTEKDEHK